MISTLRSVPGFPLPRRALAPRQQAIVAGYDWGARTAAIVAALWPERYEAACVNLHLILAPSAPGPIRAISRAPRWAAPGAAHAIDVDQRGNGMVAGPRLYQLIRQSGPVGDRRFEVEFLDPGVEAFSFTFG